MLTQKQNSKFSSRFIFQALPEASPKAQAVAVEAPKQHEIQPAQQQVLASIQKGLENRGKLLQDIQNPVPDAISRAPEQKSSLSTTLPLAPTRSPETPAPAATTKDEKSILSDLLEVPGMAAILMGFAKKIEEWGLGDFLRLIPGVEKYLPKPTQSPQAPAENLPASSPAPSINSGKKTQDLLAKYAEIYKNRKINIGEMQLNFDGKYNPAEYQAVKAVCDILGITEKVGSAEELLMGLSNNGAQMKEDLNTAKDMQPGDVVFFKFTNAQGEFQLANAGVITSPEPEMKVRILLVGKTQTTEIPFNDLKDNFFSFVKLPQQNKNASILEKS